MSKKFLFVGTYCGLNKGDRLMQHVLAEQLKIKYGSDAEITIASPFPHIDSTLYDFKIVKSYRRNLPLSFLKILFLFILPINLRKKIARRLDEVKHYLGKDLVIDLSGDMLTEDYGVHVALSHSLPILNAKLLNVDYAIVAQSIGPFRALKPLFKYILSNAEFISAREPFTYSYLKDLKFSNIEQVADLGFLLKAHNNQPSKIDSHQINSRTIALAPSALLDRKFNKKLGISSEQFISELSNLLKTLCERSDSNLLLIPHVQSPKGGGDIFLCEKIAKKIGKRAIVLDSKLSPSEVKSEISKTNLLITFRMHAAIAALDSGVPTIAISYSHKTIGLFKSLDLEKWVIPFDDNILKSLESKVEMAINQRLALSKSILEKLPEVRALSIKNIQLIDQKIHKHE